MIKRWLTRCSKARFSDIKVFTSGGDKVTLYNLSNE